MAKQTSKYQYRMLRRETAQEEVESFMAARDPSLKKDGQAITEYQAAYLGAIDGVVRAFFGRDAFEEASRLLDEAIQEGLGKPGQAQASRPGLEKLTTVAEMLGAFASTAFPLVDARLPLGLFGLTNTSITGFREPWPGAWKDWTALNDRFVHTMDGTGLVRGDIHAPSLWTGVGFDSKHAMPTEEQAETNGVLLHDDAAHPGLERREGNTWVPMSYSDGEPDSTAGNVEDLTKALLAAFSTEEDEDSEDQAPAMPSEGTGEASTAPEAEDSQDDSQPGRGEGSCGSDCSAAF